jgi:hypothetical protein
MPQFDHTTFFTQVIWFLFFFLNFYFLIVFLLMPIVSKNIKFRKKKVLKGSQLLIGSKLDTVNKNMQLNNFHQYFYFNFQSYFNSVLNSNLLLNSKSYNYLTNLVGLKKQTTGLRKNLFSFPRISLK